MAKGIYRFRCPCCRKQLEFDTGSRKARLVEIDPDAPGEKLDELLDAQKREGERLGDAFQEAARDATTQTDKFDDLFSKALEEAKDDDEKPRSPFDLD